MATGQFTKSPRADINEVPQSDWGQPVQSPPDWETSILRSSLVALTTTMTSSPGGPILGDAHYHALQTVFKTRFNRVQMNLSYTWSHSIGNVPFDEANGSVGSQTLTSGFNPSFDRGNTQINRPQIFVGNIIVPLPELRGSNAFVREAAGGWQISSIFTAESGPSTTIFQSGISENLRALGCTQSVGPERWDAQFRLRHGSGQSWMESWC